MPAVGGEHQRPVLGPERRLGQLHRVVEDALVQLLAAGIQGLELAGDRRRLGGVIGEQQAQPLGRLADDRSEEHTSELQSRQYLVCRLLLEKKKKKKTTQQIEAEAAATKHIRD